jgi:hypothetical protein
VPLRLGLRGWKAAGREGFEAAVADHFQIREFAHPIRPLSLVAEDALAVQTPSGRLRVSGGGFFDHPRAARRRARLHCSEKVNTNEGAGARPVFPTLDYVASHADQRVGRSRCSQEPSSSVPLAKSSRCSDLARWRAR